MKNLSKVVFGFFKPPPDAPRLQDQETIQKRYGKYRNQILFGSMIGYAFFYLTRKNISAALPLLSKELGYSNTDLGILGSLLYASYGISKGFFGLICDRLNPRTFMAVGLLLSALMNIFFSFSASLVTLGIFWCLNGVFQATGAPCCAKTMSLWFSISERGTKWGIWNISHQGGGGTAIVLCGFLVSWLGWRSAFWIPAIACGLGAFLVYLLLRDRPQELGLPPIATYRKDPETSDPEKTDTSDGSGNFQKIVKRVFMNPYIFLLAFASLCVYTVRYGVLDWGTKYLVDVKGMEVSSASLITSLNEFVGIPGMLLAGWLSDRVFKARRVPICVIYLLALALATYLLYMIPPGNPVLDAVVISFIGFFTYGPQLLISGVAAVDSCGSEVAAAAIGVTGLFSYLGGILSNAGTGVVVDRHGWGGGFALWIGSAIIGVLVLLPMWKSRGRRK